MLSGFISPLINRRSDDYGGTLANRLRYPLEVFAATRAVWPAALPMSVRISARDRVDGGITPDDAVEIARAFKAAGADMIDCSSGQVSADQKPVYGRMHRTPFADRIRNEVGIATIVVHLANPAWALTEVAKIGYTTIDWPVQYRSGKAQVETLVAREKAAAAAPKFSQPA